MWWEMIVNIDLVGTNHSTYTCTKPEVDKFRDNRENFVSEIGVCEL